MEAHSAAHPRGSLEAVAAVGLAYIAFARAEPGVFRLVSGLTEGHENDPDLLAKDKSRFTLWFWRRRLALVCHLTIRMSCTVPISCGPLSRGIRS
ncbi:MAG: TetR-like C-terminal domain-containing protein [Paracoccaceae bacterium]|uniref:TetR-like C-terminal domain-containing protein n=1 Tax=Seohaeicola saemankumensis TaxID=481181 RepID=UPI001E3709E5|nr:hypothetical protein [Seohaeicola saemankumensis]MCD1627266.1 hypothetical protein [Seohaeicola saemankumensis]